MLFSLLAGLVVGAIATKIMGADSNWILNIVLLSIVFLLIIFLSRQKAAICKHCKSKQIVFFRQRGYTGVCELPERCDMQRF